MDEEQKILIDAFRVSHETIHSLSVYQSLLIEWNERFNLVASSTLPHIWTRHFLDSAQLMPLVPRDAKILADMGSGAGFPGLVLAIMAKDLKRPLQIHLIESTQKKAKFLQTVSDTLKLDVIIHQERIEALKDLKADVITARALKALPELLKYTHRLAHKDTVCLFLKGKNAAEELTQAKKYWTFKTETHPSCSDDSGSVLVLKDLRYKT